MPDVTGQSMGVVFEMEDKMKPAVGGLTKVWKSFGKLFDRQKKDVNKGFKDMAKSAEGLNDNVEDIKDNLNEVKKTTALQGLVQGFQALQGARIDGVSDDIESFTKNTADMRKLLGWTREDMLSFRKEARMSAKDVGAGVLDMNLFSEALEGAAQAGVKNRDTLIEIGKAATLLSEFAGGASEDIAKTMWKLEGSVGFTSDSVENLMANMAELRKEGYGINVNFEQLLATVQETSGQLEAGFRDFDATAKRNVIDNLVAIQASFESAFGEDAPGMVKELMSQVAKGEGAFVTLLGGVDEAKRILAEGDPTKILMTMQQRIEGIDSTLGLAKIAEGMGMTMENVVKLKDSMGDLVGVGNTAYNVMQSNARSMDEFGMSAEASLGWSERAFRSVKNWVSTQPLVASFTDTLENTAPALQAMHSGWVLLSGLGIPKLIGKMTFGFVKLGAAMLMNPIGMIVAGVAALSAGIVLLIKHWDDVTDAVGNFFSFVGDMVGEAGNWVSGVFDTVIGALTAPFELVKNFINTWIIDPLNSVLSYDLPVVGPIGELVGIGNIPQLAQGGIVTGPTVAEIAEQGETEVVFPLSQLERFLSTPPPNVYIENRFDELVREIRDLKAAILGANVGPGGGGLRNSAAKSVVNWNPGVA